MKTKQATKKRWKVEEDFEGKRRSQGGGRRRRERERKEDGYVQSMIYVILQCHSATHLFVQSICTNNYNNKKK
jgi:hypothetical protein